MAALVSTQIDLPHWNFFRILEGDLESCFRYVQPIPAHHLVTSDEFARIILQAGVETENVLREFCVDLGCTPSRSDKIGTWWKCIESAFPRLREAEVGIPRYSIDGVRPWERWTATSGPDWWSNGYNKIKHDRLGNPTAASLIHAVDAVGGLLIALLYRFRELTPLVRSMPIEMAPRLFEVRQPDHGWIGGGIWTDWHLPDDPPP